MVSIIVYILNTIIVEAFNINTHNSLWSGIFFILLLVPLCIGCVINSSLFKEKNSKLRFLFYYFSFMCSLGILLISILTHKILNTNQSLIILSVYVLLFLSSLIGYLIQKKCGFRYKKIFGYFTILFLISSIITACLCI